MHIRVILDERALRFWQVDLINQLSRRKNTVIEIDFVGRQTPLPHQADALFRFEGVLHGLPALALIARAPVSALNAFATTSDVAADVTIDFCDDSACAGSTSLRLKCDGLPGDIGILNAIIERRAPLVEVVSDRAVHAAGRLGTEHRGLVSAAFEDMMGRATTLIIAALDGAATAKLPKLPDDVTASQSNSSVDRSFFRSAIRQLPHKVLREAYRATHYSPHWKVGWRKIDGPDFFDLRRHSPGGWIELPDDGSRFYADPFPILHEGKVTLFVEDFEHRTGKGVISAVEFGSDGPIGAPKPVLEQSGHLSYPFVFERDGTMWMIPESCSARAVELYRATKFPGGWVRHATLIADVVASDATLLERDGLWWLFATVRGEAGSYSDALHLWSAPDFRGPWTPHPRNPVLIDIASARPAGRFVERNGQLYRPVQDCRDGYGAALAIARVDMLDQNQFSQSVETIIGPDPLWSGKRMHTLNSAGGIEFIDGAAFAPRWKAWRTAKSA
jgi:hypothetical protein